MRQHPFNDSIRTVKNSNLEGEPVRDITSPKLFTPYLQHSIINKINWENKGVRIDGEYLSHIIFADDIVLIANSTSKLQEMLQDVHDTSKPVGLKMHVRKTKVICTKHVNKDDVIVDGKTIEEVDSYVYLGQMVTKDHDQVLGLKRRIGQGWSAFCNLDNIIRDKNVPMRLKRKTFNDCIFPVMTYGCETWSLSKHPTCETGHNSKEDGENHDRSHLQG